MRPPCYRSTATGEPCEDCTALVLKREVRPVLRIRLELVALFAGISALSFWASMTW